MRQCSLSKPSRWYVAEHARAAPPVLTKIMQLGPMAEIRALRDHTDIAALSLTLQGVRRSGINDEGCGPDSQTSRKREGGGLVFQCKHDFMPNVRLYTSTGLDHATVQIDPRRSTVAPEGPTIRRSHTLDNVRITQVLQVR